MKEEKQAAKTFLDDLTTHLNEKLPDWQQISREVPSIVLEAKGRDDWKHKRTPEDAFLHHYAIPIVFDLLCQTNALGEDGAKSSLLSEFYRNMPEMCSGSPARAMKYGNPFGKLFTSSNEIMDRWQGLKGGARLNQPCPDFALRSPFAHRILFEGKYFPRGGRTAGEKHLVETSYQAFFYRAQPPAEENSSGIPWDYDYACLLACDTSPEGGLASAWSSLREDVKDGFWNGANVFVMILRPGA